MSESMGQKDKDEYAKEYFLMELVGRTDLTDEQKLEIAEHNVAVMKIESGYVPVPQADRFSGLGCITQWPKAARMDPNSMPLEWQLEQLFDLTGRNQAEQPVSGQISPTQAFLRAQARRANRENG